MPCRDRCDDGGEAATTAASLRFPIVMMTSFAFIVGLLPLVIATDAEAATQRAVGTAVFGGMPAASCLGIFVIPGLYVLFQKTCETLKALPDRLFHRRPAWDPDEVTLWCYLARIRRPWIDARSLPKELRRHYLYSLLKSIRITWPVLSSLLVLQAVQRAIVGLIEGSGIGKDLYFAFITGLTIGYGDYVPTRPLTQILAIVIGFSGIALGGLVAALAMKSFQRRRLP